MRPVNLVLIGLALGGFILPYHTAWAQAPAPSGAVITIAGNGSGGFSGDGGPATSASFGGPYGLAIGPDGTLYVADLNNFRIRAIDPVTGIITTVAGTGSNGNTGNGGPATAAPISDVLAIAVDRARNALYLGEVSNNWVRKVDLSTGLITVYAGTGMFGSGFSGDGGPATSAEFGFVEGVATDSAGRLSIVDIFNSRVRRVDPITGIITTIAGNGNSFTAGDGGPATSASFETATSLAADSAGNVFVNDNSASSRVRRIDAVTGIITTVAGGGTNPPGAGPATDVNLAGINNYLAVDDAGTLFLAHGNQVFKVDLTTGQLSPFAGAASGGFSGDGGPALDARFETITGLTLAPGGGLIISDHFNQRIRYVVPNSIHLSGDSGQTAFSLPWVSALSGDLIITNNPNLLVINASALTTVSGDLDISGNTAATVINAGALMTVAGELNVSGNVLAGELDLGALTTAGAINVADNTAVAGELDLHSLVSAGELTISGNTSADAINVSSLTTVSGDLEITDNTSATAINAGALMTVAGELNVSGNVLAGELDLGALTTAGAVNVADNTAAAGELDLHSLVSAGELTISGNTSADAINVGSLTTVGGDLEITDNAAATVDVSSLTTVAGDMQVETSGQDAVDLSGVAVGGSSSVEASGATTLMGQTAAESTAATLVNGPASMTVMTPEGTFAAPVDFALHQLSSGELSPQPGDDEGQGVTVDPVTAYEISFNAVSLNQPASVSFDIVLAGLAAPERESLLDAIELGTLTLAVKGDAPGSEYRLFDVAAAGAPAVLDEVVRLLKLDALEMPLPTGSMDDPAILRFEALVSHFSTYAVVSVSDAPSEIADFDGDSDVDGADLVAWTSGFGMSGAATRINGDADGDQDVDGADFLEWQRQLGSVANAGRSVNLTAAVPEPTIFGVLQTGALAMLLCRRAAPL